jgi:hypothetical protein
MMIFATAVFFVLSVYFLVLGFRGLVGKKPFLFSAKSSFWVILLAFAPSMISPIYSFWKVYSSATENSIPFEWSYVLVLLIPLTLYPVLLVFYWRILRGYTVVGVTDESFRQALYSVLGDLKIPYEERLSKMHLTALNADLEANVSSWMGTASVRIRQREHQETLDRIARAMSSYFAGSHVAVNMVTCVYYLIFGIIILLAAGTFTYVFVFKDSSSL